MVAVGIDYILKQQAALVPDEEIIDIASQLTAIPSFTGHETELAKHIHTFLEANGIHPYLQEVEPGRFQTIALLGAQDKKPALLLNGHLDMDPLGRDWTDDPYKVRRVNDELHGAGLHNMKSGVAAILAAALTIKRSGLKLARPLLLEFVVGELQGGKGTLFALKQGLTADAAVVPEPYSVRRILTRTAGVHKFAIVVRGKTAHTSRYEEGVDAVAVLRKVLDYFETSTLGLRSKDFPTLPRLQVASLLAGRGEEYTLSGVSYCADKATAVIDLRYPPPYEPDDVERAIKSVAQKAQKLYPEADIRIDHPPEPIFEVGGADMPPMDVIPGSSVVRDIAGLLPKVSSYNVEETGVVLPYSYCGNDTTHLSRAGIECCLFGPRGNPENTEHHVLVSEMVACARTLAALTALRCG